MVSKLFDTNYVNCDHVYVAAVDPANPYGVSKAVCSKCGFSPNPLQISRAVLPNDGRVPFRKFTVTLPDSLAGYENDIRRFIDAMIYKLEKNAHKGKWEDLSAEQAVKRLDDEVAELKAEIGGNHIKIVLEAADVANFALMVANIATERGK